MRCIRVIILIWPCPKKNKPLSIIDDVFAEMRELLESSPEFKTFVEAPGANKDEKMKVFDQVSQREGFDPTTANLFKVRFRTEYLMKWMDLCIFFRYTSPNILGLHVFIKSNSIYFRETKSVRTKIDSRNGAIIDFDYFGIVETPWVSDFQRH